MPPPSKLTQSVISDLATAVRSGQYLDVAAAFVNIDRVTLNRWLKTGARAQQRLEAFHASLTPHESLCVVLRNAVTKAMADAEVQAIGRIAQAAMRPAVLTRTTTVTDAEGNATTTTVREERPPDWRADAWRMERRFSRRWGQRGSLEVAGPEGGPIPVEHRVAEVADKIRKLRGLPSPDDAIDVDEVVGELGA